MTYKNIKFEESPVFRSLEKLAVKKGLIKPEEFKKEASAKPAPSFAPTKNVSQNILKLCSGLRAQGFESYANELENKFLSLKQAENMMEVAHPEGSIKLPDMEGDATVEDFEEQKKKIEEIVKKTPKGKFGQDIVNLVKITLAQATDTPETKESLEAIESSNLSAALNIWNEIDRLVEKEGGLVNGLGVVGRGMEYTIQSKMIKGLLKERPVKEENLEELQSRFDTVLKILKPGVSLTQWNPFGGASKDLYNTVSDSIAGLTKYVNAAMAAQKKIQKIRSHEISELGKTMPDPKPQAIPTEAPKTNKATADINQYIQALQSWKVQIGISKDLTAQEKATADKWIEEQTKEFNDVLSAWNSIPDTQKPGAYAKFTERFNSMKQESMDFFNEWVQ